MGHLEETHPLCDFCKTIPFEKLSGKNLSVEEYALKKVSEMLKTPDCPLCQTVLRVLDLDSRGWFAKLVDIFVDRSNYHLKGSYWASASNGSKYFRPILDCGDGVCFDLIRDQAKRHNEVFTRRLLKEQINPDMLRSWYKLCDDNHFCKPPDEGIMKQLNQTGFRLIDVESMSLVGRVWPSFVEYVALSYVWGRVDQYSVNTHIYTNITSEPKDSPSSFRDLTSIKLPRTLMDAIEVVRILRQRYLWVDSICIDQSNVQEKTSIIAQMNSIYKRASLTIVAAAGAGADDGLAGISHDSRTAEKLVEIKTATGSWKMLQSRPSLRNILDRSIWSQRGWTFQEHLFSSRCLFFSERECFWTCPRGEESADWRESYTLEAFGRDSVCYDSSTQYFQGPPVPDLSAYKNFYGLTKEPFVKWQYIVEEYTARKLTNPSDVLLAIESTVIRLWKDKEPDGIRQFGIPLDDLYFFAALTWQAKSTLTRRVTDPMLPSWSWAGWIGRIEYPHLQSTLLRKLHHGSDSIESYLSVYNFEKHGVHNIALQPNAQHDLWASFELNPEDQSSLDFSDVLTLHIHTAFIKGKLKGPVDVNHDSSTEGRKRLDQYKRFIKYVPTVRRPHFEFALGTPICNGRGQARDEFGGTFYIDGPQENFESSKEYTIIIFSADLDALVVAKVGDFYERIGVGRFWHCLPLEMGQVLPQYGFKLGWFSVR